MRAVVPPTVPTRRVRVCLHAGNTYAQIEGLVRRVEMWLVEKVRETDGVKAREGEVVKARI